LSIVDLLKIEWRQRRLDQLRSVSDPEIAAPQKIHFRAM